jgi:hypothetical protein
VEGDRRSPLEGRLSVGELAVLRVRHGARMLSDVAWFARANRLWWLLPLIVLGLVGALAAGATQTAVPYAVYTLL